MEPSARADQRRHDQVDVVVGFGGAGACAALEAAKNGAAVIALDRFQGGGATAASGAIIYAGGGTPYHKAAGFDDRPKEMYQYSKLEVGQAATDATLRRFCQESAGSIAWLEKAGVPFEASLGPFKTSYPTDASTSTFLDMSWSSATRLKPSRLPAATAPRDVVLQALPFSRPWTMRLSAMGTGTPPAPGLNVFSFPHRDL